MFFFLTQYLQDVRGESPLQAGLSFLPMTLVLFALVRVVPRVAARIGDLPLLVGGLLLAATGMAWLSQITETHGLRARHRRAADPDGRGHGRGLHAADDCGHPRRRRQTTPVRPPGWSTSRTSSAARSASPSW